MNKNIAIAVITIVLIGGGAWYMLSQPATPQDTNATAQDQSSITTQPTGQTQVKGSTAPDYQPQPLTNQPAASDTKSPQNKTHVIIIKTNYGDIQFETYDADAPKTVENFLTLAKKGFYDGLTFHRVIAGFMIQGGDPSGNGSGGPGYTIPDENKPNSPLYQVGYQRGIVAMARTSQPNSGGSQFFIMHQDYPLPPDYTIFGHVVKGIEVVDKIANVSVGGPEKSTPLSPVKMEKVTVANVQQ